MERLTKELAEVKQQLQEKEKQQSDQTKPKTPKEPGTVIKSPSVDTIYAPAVYRIADNIGSGVVSNKINKNNKISMEGVTTMETPASQKNDSPVKQSDKLEYQDPNYVNKCVANFFESNSFGRRTRA